MLSRSPEMIGSGAAVGIGGVDSHLGARVDVGSCRLEQRRAGCGHEEGVRQAARLLFRDCIGERVPEP